MAAAGTTRPSVMVMEFPTAEQVLVEMRDEPVGVDR